jgi:hypothetical protein
MLQLNSALPSQRAERLGARAETRSGRRQSTLIGVVRFLLLPAGMSVPPAAAVVIAVAAWSTVGLLHTYGPGCMAALA